MIVAIAIALIIFGSKIFFPQTNMIAADNFGYYLHLPARFIYDDPALKGDWINVINDKYNNTPTFYQLMKSPKGGTIDRFFCGMAILWTPAFFTGHWAAGLLNYPADGFSAPYQWALILYGAIFAIIGLFYLRKVLLKFFSDGVTAITLLIMFLGTNLFFFSGIGNDVPHVYIFSLFAALIYYTIKWHEVQKWTYMLGIGIVAGLIIAVRPSEIIAMAIPAFWGITSLETLKNKFNLLWKYKFQIVSAIVLAGLFFLPQLMYYRTYAGEYFVNVYNDAGSTLNLSNPRFGYVLFGFRKGWFIYSPLSFLAVLGLIFTWKHQRVYFWPVLIYLLVNVYLIASFTSLVSYGWRAFVQSYAILTLPLGSLVFVLARLKKGYKAIIIVLLLPLFVLNMHQAWQVRMGIIDGSRMTKDYYFSVLGKNSITDADRNKLMIERSLTSVDDIDPNRVDFHSTVLSLSFDDQLPGPEVQHQPKQMPGMLKMSASSPYSNGIKEAYTHFSSNYFFYLKGSVWVFGNSEDIPEKVYIVFSTKNTKGEELKYRAYSFKLLQKEFKAGEWSLLTADYLTPEIQSKEEIVQSYIWYNGSGEVWIDDFKIDLYAEK
jgi:hypothetical protein